MLFVYFVISTRCRSVCCRTGMTQVFLIWLEWCGLQIINLSLNSGNISQEWQSLLFMICHDLVSTPDDWNIASHCVLCQVSNINSLSNNINSSSSLLCINTLKAHADNTGRLGIFITWKQNSLFSTCHTTLSDCLNNIIVVRILKPPVHHHHVTDWIIL